MTKSVKKTQEQAENELHSAYKNIDLISTYTGANDKVQLRCNECGHEWSTTLRSVITSKHGCPKCGVEKAKLEQILERFKTRLKDTNFEFVEYAGKQNNTHLAKVRCKSCGHYRVTNFNNIYRFGCDHCSRKNMPQSQPKSLLKFIEDGNNVHNNKYDYSKVIYSNCETKVVITCPIHGDFQQTPSKHLTGQGCPKCNCSRGETYINRILNNNNIPFIYQYRLDGNNRFYKLDFYILINDKQFAIEYNGRQHYESVEYFGGDEQFEKQKQRDLELRELCLNLNIKLFEIKYDSNIEDEISKILEELLPLLQETVKCETDEIGELCDENTEITSEIA